eukprot:TRINITY_DN12218_c0_g1_i1.p1 TRINITY_DN12218_c0_g1~~TRINITY_DN12218_c0_g1_i1.p1  ORF type:complete len:374 (-),score=151.78 TRINITY_DN12218_c0_g1_i1:432-1553(-)
MAPQAKRSLAAQDASSKSTPAKTVAAKKPKVATADTTMQAVVDGLEASTDLPVPCRQMLLAMLPGSLGMPADGRSEEQERVVAMVKQIIDGVLQKLEQDLAREEQRVKDLETEKAAAATKIHEADEAATAAVETTAAKKTALVEADQTLKTATAAHEDALEKQREGDAPLLSSESELSDIRQAVEGSLRCLSDTEQWSADRVSAWCDSVAEALKSCNVAESMLISVRASCAVAPGARGDFEKMVVGQLEKTCTDRLAKLAASLEEATPARTARQAAVDEAGAAAAAAEAARKAASEAVLDAEVEESNSAAAAKSAKEASAQTCSALEAAVGCCEQARTSLEQFQKHNVAGFETLRTKRASAAAQDAAVTVGGA